MAYMHGINGMRLVNTTDFSEGVVLAAATRRAAELAEIRDENLAIEITNRVVEAWNRGQK